MTEARNLGTPVASVDERRALDADEWLLADQTRTPAIFAMSDDTLDGLIAQLKDRREQAGKPSGPVEGSSTPWSESGLRSKWDYLGEALERAAAEQDLRAERRSAHPGAMEGEAHSVRGRKQARQAR